MLYEKPQLISLSGKAWDAAGQCTTGISTSESGGKCAVGVHAPTGVCDTGAGPDPAAPCDFGSGDGQGCVPGGGAGGPSPVCLSGAAGGTTSADCSEGFAPGPGQCGAGTGPT
jgi:hypothetical protein